MPRAASSVDPVAVFVLTSNNLHEGGRQRVGEAYLNVNRQRFEFFDCFEFKAITDNGMQFLVRLSGSSGSSESRIPKNLRSIPNRALGIWLRGYHHAQAGDEVHASRVPGFGFRFTFVRRVPDA